MAEKIEKLQLKAEPRIKKSGENSRIREKGFIPGVVYGRGIENVLVKVKGDAFIRVFREAGEHTLVDLNLEGKDTRTVLIHDVNVDPLKGNPVHVDFYQVRLDETVRTEIPLTFYGISAAVKDKEGTLIKSMHSVEIEALPTDIPHEIVVDISSLETFEDQILVKDIKVGSGVKILAEEDETVASVEPPKTQEELEELEQEVVEDLDTVEGVDKEGEGDDEEEPQKSSKEEKDAGEQKEDS